MNCSNHPEVPSSAFCQYCGKPLCKDCIRNVGGSIFCETCLAERLRGGAAGTATPIFTGTPHPMLAALLGFIPGVGAMYNGQYGKAIAHVVIFAILASLGDHAASSASWWRRGFSTRSSMRTRRRLPGAMDCRYRIHSG